MRKWLSIVLLLTMLTTALAACGSPSLTQPSDSQNPGIETPSDPQNPGIHTPTAKLDPETVVRLLLASERLDPAHLKSEGDIFENGSEIMRALAAKTLDSMKEEDTLTSMSADVRPLFGASASETVYDGGANGGKVTFDGKNYVFSDFREVSNSYQVFSRTANGIALMAEEAAVLIDNIKKSVRVVDKWAKLDEMRQYYLHVGENEEILYGRVGDRESICRRYRNEDGLNVYEYYQTSGKYYDRMVYIPGVHFEMIRGVPNDPYGSDYMIADNTKGYWESYWVGPHPTHYNVSYMVMKDDICYDSFYDPKNGTINFLKIISADKKTDLFYYMGTENDALVTFDIQLCGFDGYYGIEADPSVVENTEVGGDIGFVPLITQMEQSRLLLKNGSTVKMGDLLANGRAEVTALRLPFFYPQYTAELSLTVRASSTEEYLEILKASLDEMGLTCRRDMNTVLPGVKRAFNELREITKYHTWNGFNQATEEGIAAAIRAEDADTASFCAMLETVRNAEIIDVANSEAVALNAHFAPVSIAAKEALTHKGMTLTVGALTLSIDDTVLFVENEPYTIAFALSGEDGLVHLKAENAQTTVYTDTDSFSVSVRDVSLTLPTMTNGKYTLVAYIATADGIRSSAATALPCDTVDPETVTLTHSTVTASSDQNGAFAVTYEPITDHYITLTHDQPIGYRDFYTLLASYVCQYGIPTSDVIEILSGDESGSYTALTGEETSIASGTYRLSYNSENGTYTVNGYLYVTFTAAQ